MTLQNWSRKEMLERVWCNLVSRRRELRSLLFFLFQESKKEAVVVNTVEKVLAQIQATER
jgi:hypothetical protein